MNPYLSALAAFNDNRGPMTFDEFMAWHFNNGFIHSTPEFFICGRPVDSKADSSLILDYSHEFDRKDCDAWHVALAAGDLSKAWGVLPWPLPLIGFDRQHELRFYPIARVREFTHR